MDRTSVLEHWLASAALKELVDANPQNNAAMFASVFQDNPASARVLIHCGFDYLGDAESYSVAVTHPFQPGPTAENCDWRRVRFAVRQTKHARKSPVLSRDTCTARAGL